MSSEQIISLSAGLIFLALAILFFVIHILVKKKNEAQATLNIYKPSIWDFTKKHFLSYTAIFCLVMSIAAFMMLIFG